VAKRTSNDAEALPYSIDSASIPTFKKIEHEITQGSPQARVLRVEESRRE